MSIDTLNKFGVGVQGNKVVLVFPPTGPISAEDAMVLAAYLVSMAEVQTETKFLEVLNAVQNC